MIWKTKETCISGCVGRVKQRFQCEEDKDLLAFMLYVGLWYLTLDSQSATQPIDIDIDNETVDRVEKALTEL